MGIISSITDKPVQDKNTSLLNIDHYANALTEFILDSGTPLTIGFQGEWGTGKTSLMYLVQEGLSQKNVVTSWVNTWEYSLFKEPVEITPGVLTGLLNNLVCECKKKGYWSKLQKVDELYKSAVEGLSSLGNILLKAGAAKFFGLQLSKEAKTEKPKEIAELKSEIQQIIDKIIENDNNPIEKIVFFVDDLDRIDPSIAVEVLEALKNLFDINRCVFILAIDYEVVVKGLERKYGKKTEANEREFRSFFDKIIQVPFTMPISAYAIDNLLKKSLTDVGIRIQDNLIENYIDIVRLTVGYIPRSVKRYVNSFSLLKKIRGLINVGSETNKNEPNLEEELIEFCLFVLIGIQISYPKIFRLFSKEHPFLEWDENFASQIGVDDIVVPDTEYEFTDEKWEQILWCFCQRDPYYKARATNIIRVLNIMRSQINENFDYVDKAMVFASMTSVDDDTETKDNTGGYKRNILSGIDEYIAEISKNNDVPIEIVDLLRLIDQELRIKFEDEIDNNTIKIQYTPTGGISYNYKKLHGAKFLGLAISHFGSPHIELTLLRTPDNQYKNPENIGIEVKNYRSYTLENGYKNLHFIEYFKIVLNQIDDYNEHVKTYITNSYEVRVKDKVLKKSQKKMIKAIILGDDQD